jgi:hypothetical protein
MVAGPSSEENEVVDVTDACRSGSGCAPRRA